jgi:hypothetical protein
MTLEELIYQHQQDMEALLSELHALRERVEFLQSLLILTPAQKCEARRLMMKHEIEEYRHGG